MDGGTTRAETSLSSKFMLDTAIVREDRSCTKRRTKGAACKKTDVPSCSQGYSVHVLSVILLCDRSSVSRDDGSCEGLPGVAFELDPAVKGEMAFMCKSRKEVGARGCCCVPESLLEGIYS